MLRRGWSRASLVLALGFVLVASAQNSQSTLPGAPVPPNSTEEPAPVAASPQLPHAFPRTQPVPLEGRVRPDAAKIQATVASTQSQLFLDTSAPQYATGSYPTSVAVGDFNGDGRPDLAVASKDFLSVLLGNGDGTFQTCVDVAIGSRSVVVGDFNDDGKADLAVTNFGGSVSVLLGNGDCTFQTELDFAVGPTPTSLAIGDFNGDGKPDLVVGNSGNTSVSVLLGNGDGTFRTHVDYATKYYPTALAVGDFDGDGKADLAVTSADYNLALAGVSVLLGNGDGTFQTHVDYATIGYPSSVAIGDLNGDGKADLAITTLASLNPSVSVLLGNGDGTFQMHLDYATIGDPSSVAIGDFNGDGKADLAATISGNNSVSVLLGNGDGTFQAHMDYATGTNPMSVAIGDFNGDGKADLVITNFYNDSVSVLSGNGDGTFPNPPRYATGSYPTSVAVGDFNGDGKADLVTTNVFDNSVSVLLGNGDGTFQTHMDYATGQGPGSVAIGDFNGDGKADLAVTVYDPGAGSWVSVLLGNGDGTFQTYVNYATGQGPTSVAIGDFNGDGKADLAVTSDDPTLQHSGVNVLLGNGDGTFQTHVDYAAGLSPTSVAIGDFNGDGKADLAVIDSFESVNVLLGNGDGTFQTYVDYAAGSSPTSVAIGDFNGDGKADLAITTFVNLNPSVSVLLGNGDGTFQTHMDFLLDPIEYAVFMSLAIGDFNGDGKADLAVIDSLESVNVLLGNGDGTFPTSVKYAKGQGTQAIAVADFNRDGALDLAFLTPWNAVGVLLNVRGTVVELQASSNPSTFGQSVMLTSTVLGYGIGTPSGTVMFMDGTEALGSKTLSVGGVATFSVGTLKAGTHSITAVYSGDNKFNPGPSEVLNQIVEPVQDFGISATPGVATVTVGTSVDFAVTATAMNGFNSTVSLSCSVSPSPTFAPACTFTPTSVTVTANGSATSKLTVTTTGSTASLRFMFRHGSKPRYALLLPIFGLAVLGVGFRPHRTRKKISAGLLVGLVLISLWLQAACGGGGSSNHNTFSGTPPGQYTVTVNATSGSIAHSTSVTITIQ